MPENAFGYFLQRKNARIVRLLETNHNVSGAIQGLLEHLTDFADEKGVRFDQVVIDNLHVTRDDQLVARLLVKR